MTPRAATIRYSVRTIATLLLFGLLASVACSEDCPESEPLKCNNAGGACCPTDSPYLCKGVCYKDTKRSECVAFYTCE